MPNITRIDVGTASSLLGAFGGGFGWGKNIIRVYYTNKEYSRLFRDHWGAGWGGWQRAVLDDTSFLGSITRIDVGAASSLLGAFGGGFGQGKNVIRVYYTNKEYSHLFRDHWGAGWGGWQRAVLDDASFLGSITRIDAGAASSLLGAIGGRFGWGNFDIVVPYTNKKLSCPFPCYWGAGWDGLQRDTLDDVFYLIVVFYL